MDAVGGIFRIRKSRLRMVLGLAAYAAFGGLILTALRWSQYRFLLGMHAVEIYVGLVAAVFAAVGIWLGRTLTRKEPETRIVEVSVPALEPFIVDERRRKDLGVSARELEILGCIAAGLSNREIAGKLFVSENTVKTHSSRLFQKLGARRRTQAVQLGREAGLIA